MSPKPKAEAAARCIQAVVRRRLAHLQGKVELAALRRRRSVVEGYDARLERELLSAVTIQRATRSHIAVTVRQQRKEFRRTGKASVVRRDAAVVIQRAVRIQRLKRAVSPVVEGLRSLKRDRNVATVRSEAAAVVQRAFRRWQPRLDRVDIEGPVARIQRCVRRYIARCRRVEQRDLRKERYAAVRQQEAAAVVQRHVRCVFARRMRHSLRESRRIGKSETVRGDAAAVIRRAWDAHSAAKRHQRRVVALRPGDCAAVQQVDGAACAVVQRVVRQRLAKNKVWQARQRTQVVEQEAHGRELIEREEAGEADALWRKGGKGWRCPGSSISTPRATDDPSARVTPLRPQTSCNELSPGGLTDDSFITPQISPDGRTAAPFNSFRHAMDVVLAALRAKSSEALRLLHRSKCSRKQRPPLLERALAIVGAFVLGKLSRRHAVAMRREQSSAMGSKPRDQLLTTLQLAVRGRRLMRMLVPRRDPHAPDLLRQQEQEMAARAIQRMWIRRAITHRAVSQSRCRAAEDAAAIVETTTAASMIQRANCRRRLIHREAHCTSREEHEHGQAAAQSAIKHTSYGEQRAIETCTPQRAANRTAPELRPPERVSPRADAAPRSPQEWLKARRERRNQPIAPSCFDPAVADATFLQCMRRVLSQDPTCARLSLSNNSLTDGAVVSLLEAVRHSSVVQAIDLGYNFVSDTAVRALCCTLRLNPIIHTVVLRSNQVTAAGASELLMTVQQCPHVMRCDLDRNLPDSAQFTKKLNHACAQNVVEARWKSLFGRSISV